MGISSSCEPDKAGRQAAEELQNMNSGQSNPMTSNTHSVKEEPCFGESQPLPLEICILLWLVNHSMPNESNPASISFVYRVTARQHLLYPPSERSETGGYTVFTLCIRPSVCAHSEAIGKTRFEPETFHMLGECDNH